MSTTQLETEPLSDLHQAVPPDEQAVFVASIEPELVYDAQTIIASPDYRAIPDEMKRRSLVDRLASLVATPEEARIHMTAFQKHVENAPKDRLEAWAGSLALLDRSEFLDYVSIRKAADALHARSQKLRAKGVADFALQVYNRPVTKDRSV